MAYILLCRDIETACDERVIHDMEVDERRAYSTALLNCSIHRRRIAACPLAFGEVGVKARVKGVMHYKKPAFWLILICLILVAVVSVCFLTDPSSALPITMYADYVNRNQADLKFHFEEQLPKDGYQISEAYNLESLVDGIWQELPKLTEEQPSELVVEVTANNADFDAWSLPNWKDVYGPLPDGTYRITKEITIHSDSEEPERYPVYVEFAIGGTADEYVTYTLDDITPTGANLYEHETGDVVYESSEGFWLEFYWNGQWQYLEPTEYIEPVRQKEKQYIHELIYPSSHTELDWSALYGELSDGTYRIAREITNAAESDLRVCTAYVEFTLDNVYTWFDLYSDNLDERHPKSIEIDLPGLEGVSLFFDNSEDEIRMVTEEGESTIISTGFLIRNAFLTDLNNDGVSEICETIQTEARMVVQVFDPVEEKRYELPVGDDWYYILTQKADRLCVFKYDRNSNVTGYGQVSLSSDGLEVREIDAVVKALMDNMVCVDIWTRKHVCLSSGEDYYRILTLLRDLEDQVHSATKEELETAQKDDFYHAYITINYALGEKTIVFSEDFGLVWENGTDVGFRVSDPEPLRQFVEAVTDGVRDHLVSGKQFATVYSPWDWCAGMSTDAAESAQAHVCLKTYSYGNTSGSTSTNGWISYDTLEDLIRVLNRIPKSAFTPDKMLSKESYHGFFINQQAENGSVSIIDGVNNMAVLINYRNGKLTMLLTDEMEKVRENSHNYLEPTQLWCVEDQALTSFMESIIANPPVILYSIGAEYEWQAPITFEADGFSLELRLLEGWEYEYVTNPTDSGIRCRPEGINEGWIYFSYWPEEYEPVEEDRYIVEGSHFGWTTYTSYPSDVKTKGGFYTYGKSWSYERYDLEKGDYVVINNDADAWFVEYKDRIQDIMTLSNIAVK